MKPFFDMSLLIAFGFLSLLLLLGVLLRAKIKFLQNFMVPACLTGGVIGFFILNTTGFPQVQPELYPALAYHFFTISFVCIGLRGMSKVDQSKGSATKGNGARFDLAGADVLHGPLFAAHPRDGHRLSAQRADRAGLS